MNWKGCWRKRLRPKYEVVYYQGIQIEVLRNFQNVIEDNLTKDLTNLEQKHYTLGPLPGKLVYKQKKIWRELYNM